MTLAVYHEKQEKKFCTVHALNALLGKRAVSPQQMIDFVYERKDWQILREDYYHEDRGFSPVVIHHYCRQHLGVYLTPLGALHMPGSKRQFLRLAGQHSRLILHQDRHAVAVVKLSSPEWECKRDVWLVVDSLCSKPLVLGKHRPWRTLNVGSSRVDLQACKLEYSIVSPK